MTSSAPLTNSTNSRATSANFGCVARNVVLDAVHLERAAVDLALRVDVAMEAVLRRPAIDELHAADLDDPVAGGRLEARGFGIQDDLAHQRSGCLMGGTTLRVSCRTFPQKQPQSSLIAAIIGRPRASRRAR